MNYKEYTRDTGFLDGKGNLFVTGRIKNYIKTDQGLISAEEIEEIIETNDFQDPSYRCAALMITRHDQSEIVILRELEKDTDPVAHANQMDFLLRKKLILRISKILYMRRGTIPTTTSSKVKCHAEIALYFHDLLAPYYIFEF